MKWAVLGAGALGCAIGGVLTEAGHEVWLINRHADQVQRLNQQGLVLCAGGLDRTVRVRAATHAAAVGAVDVVIVLVKSFHTREAMASATALVGPQTVVISLQNGLGHEAVLAEVVGPGPVMAGKTYVGGTLLGPAHVLAGTAGKETLIGELDGTLSDRALRIGRALNEAGLITTVSDRIVGVMWDKLLVNVATGALSGITRLTYGDLYQVPEIAATAQAAVAEAMAVASALGIALNVDQPHQPWDKAAQGLPPAFKASLLQSLEKGSVTEIDFINGAVCRYGRQCGVPTPVNDTLVAAVKGLERGLRPASQPILEMLSS